MGATGDAVLFVGPQGAGKTVLVHKVRRRAATRSLACLTASFYSFGRTKSRKQSQACSPWTELSLWRQLEVPPLV